MKNKKIPMRKCVVSNELYPKKQLVRVVKNKEGELMIDASGKAAGRGAYVCLDVDIAKEAKKKHALDKALNTKVPEAFYQELIDYIEHIIIRKELFDHGS
ncbi:RNase P modulator RnpM [Catellicoccus marimammalium]|uniref:Putative nucleic-acid-binding protein implicated in transcription termination n=1 Tax=Catellicoccus marimammalium M35/04/3 TaxID=1234409 RepID=K8Z7I0_9ENTE|nr:YlxR family protein [Catellicoccus marimammalium]EKU26959.1 putative nucleic-acid-binding protein implicated in transcription termination [Catellicoccus marimammalium M35/04/3]